MSSIDAEPDASAVEADEKPKLSLEVTVEQPNACKRHVVVLISEADVDRYRGEATDEMQPKAAVPGFRPGRAPRKLVEARFRSEIEERTKGSLLLDAVTQAMDENDFSAISEPDFDFDAVALPDKGPLTLEFDVEVRPDFEMPAWEGLKLNRFATEPTDEEIDKQVERLKAKYSRTETVERPARHGDKLTVDIDVASAEDESNVLHQLEDIELPLQQEIVFPDATIADFDSLMHDIKLKEKRTVEVEIGDDAANAELAGKKAQLTFRVKQIREEVLPTTSELLTQLEDEDIESEEDLRERLRKELSHQINYHNQQAIRGQITSLLTESADLELPEDLVKRQTERELQRAVYELQAAGFPDESIRAHANKIRQDASDRTNRALKEHFILERIADEQEIDASTADFDNEIQRIAARNSESPRRVRARLEKRGEMDVIRNQIVERKVVDLICEKAEFEDKPVEDAMKPETDSYGCETPIAGTAKEDLPLAKHKDDAQQLPVQPERT